MPRAAMRCAGHLLMRSPRSNTSPLLGGKTPEIMFSTVVLPAPFGPIKALI